MYLGFSRLGYESVPSISGSVGSPASIVFGSGEVGFWYNTSSAKALFAEDGALADGEAVEAMADASEAANPDLVDFSAMTTPQALWTVDAAAGTITFAGGGGMNDFVYDCGGDLIPNAYYEVSFTATLTTGSFQIRFGSLGNIDKSVTASDDYRFIIQADDDAGIQFREFSGDAIVIANLSIRRLTSYARQATAGNRPLWNEAEKAIHFDNTDDQLDVEIPRTDNMTFMCAVKQDAANSGTIAGGGAFEVEFGVMANGSGTNSFGGVGDNVTVYVDGAEIGDTRGDLFTALADNAWHVVEYHGLNLSSTSWNTIKLGRRNANLTPLDGMLAHPILTTNTNRSTLNNLRRWLAEEKGITVADIPATPVIPPTETLPVAAGGLGPYAFDENTAFEIDTSTDFTGNGLSFALDETSDPLPDGAFLSSTTGVLFGRVRISEAARSIVVRATNSVGSAITAFPLETLSVAIDLPTGGVWSLEQTPGQSVTINMRHRNPYAVSPDVMYFDCTTSGFTTHNTLADRTQYDPSKHELLYFWRCSETKQFTKCGALTSFDEFDGGNRRNGHIGRSWNYAFCFERPVSGATVDLVVYDPVTREIATASYTVPDVGDPETLYAGNGTIYINTTGDYTFSPTAGSVNFTTFQAGLAYLNTRTDAPRIVLENGQDFTLSKTVYYQPGSDTGTERGLRIERNPYTTGDRPKLRALLGFEDALSVGGQDTAGSIRSVARASATNSYAYDFEKYADVLYGVAIDGGWLSNFPADRSGTPGEGRATGGYFAADGGPKYVAIVDCTSDGACIPYMVDADEDKTQRDDHFYGIWDSSATNWSNFATFMGQGSRHVVIGCDFSCREDAVSVDADVGELRAHGSYRSDIPNDTLIKSCDLFVSQGWSGDGVNPVKAQPCVRWNTSPEFSGAVLSITDCVMETPGEPILIERANNTITSKTANVVLDGNYLMGGFQTEEIISISHPGDTIRNTQMVIPSVVRDGTVRSFVASSGASPVDDLTVPVNIYNCTFINLTDDDTPDYASAGITFSNVTRANNIMHQPNLGVPEVDDAPVTLTEVYTPKYEGYYTAPSTFDGTVGHVAADGVVLTPADGSAALNQTLVDPQAYNSFAGDTSVPATRTTRGAIKVADEDAQIAVNTAPPQITGSSAPGSTLTLLRGVWEGADGGNFVQQWLSNGEPIGGATNITFVTTGRAGEQISALEYYVNEAGNSEEAFSNVILVNPASSTAPTVSSVVTSEDGYTLNVTFNQDMDEGIEPTGAQFVVTQAGYDGAAAGYNWLSARVLQITMDINLLPTTAITLAYTPGSVANTSGDALAAFSGQAVTNNTANPHTVSAFTVGTQAAQLPITLNMTAAGLTPLQMFIVFVANGESAPSRLQVIAGQKADGTNAATYLNAYTFSGDVTNVVVPFTRDNFSTGDWDAYAVVRDANGIVSTLQSDTGNAITITAGATLGYEVLTPKAYSGASTTSQEFTFDFSAYSVGQQVVIFHGNDSDFFSSLTLNGRVTEVVKQTDSAATNGGHIRISKHTLQEGDNSADCPVVVKYSTTNPSLAAFNIAVQPIVITDGAVDDGDVEFVNPPDDTGNGTVNPSAASNLIIECAMFRSSFLPVTWDGAQVGGFTSFGPNSLGLAVQKDVAVGAYAASATFSNVPGNPNDEAGYAVVAISQV